MVNLSDTSLNPRKMANFLPKKKKNVDLVGFTKKNLGSTFSPPGVTITGDNFNEISRLLWVFITLLSMNH